MSSNDQRITGRLVAAGRALAGVSQPVLASAAHIPQERLQLAESSGSAWLSEDVSEVLKRALESFGVAFISEENGMGAGVRLKFTRQDTRQIIRLEGEGGIALPDDVP